jgi:hypothetical protein
MYLFHSIGVNLSVKLLNFLDAISLIDKLPQSHLDLIVLLLQLLANFLLYLRKLMPILVKADISLIEGFF